MKNKYRVIRLDEVDSTNDYIKKESINFDGYVLVVSETQTKGRGRNGRLFVSSHTGIFMSMYIPKSSMSFTKISACAGVSVVKAIQELYEITTSIKWVNDIILDCKKLGGILCEKSYSNSTQDYSIVGIGINLDEVESEEIRASSSYLSKYTTVDKEELIEAIWENYFELQSNEACLMSQYREYSNTIGKAIEVIDGSLTFQAYAIGVDDDGSLLIALEDGSLKKLCSGEIHIIEGDRHEVKINE